MTKHHYFYIVALCFFSIMTVSAAELNLTYDANGNLVTGDGKFRVYNSLNQLWKVYNGSTNTTLLQEYVYDPIEERVAVKRTYNSSGSTMETVYYFSEEFVRVVNSSGTFDFTYVYHEGQLVAQNNGSATLFIHGNHEGSSSVVTNVSGGVVERTEYSPYGERLNSSSVRFGYEAEEHDGVIGDMDFDGRRYKQDWGIFEQPDTLLQDYFDPQLLNRYSFESNNPINNIDPDGHALVGIQFGGEGASGPGGGFNTGQIWQLNGDGTYQRYKFDTITIGGGVGASASGEAIIGPLMTAEDFGGDGYTAQGGTTGPQAAGPAITWSGNTPMGPNGQPRFSRSYITVGGGVIAGFGGVQLYGGKTETKTTLLSSGYWNPFAHPPRQDNVNKASSANTGGSRGSGRGGGGSASDKYLTKSFSTSSGQSVSLRASSGFIQKYYQATGKK